MGATLLFCLRVLFFKYCFTPHLPALTFVFSRWVRCFVLAHAVGFFLSLFRAHNDSFPPLLSNPFAAISFTHPAPTSPCSESLHPASAACCLVQPLENESSMSVKLCVEISFTSIVDSRWDDCFHVSYDMSVMRLSLALTHAANRQGLVR